MGQLGWDTHQQNFPRIKDTLAPPLDKGVSTLARPTWRSAACSTSTLVVMMGEFGRTPKINRDGRPRPPRPRQQRPPGRRGASRAAWSWAGPTPGATSPADRPVTPADLAATLYTALGIDPNHQFETPDGRPIRLVDNGKVPDELSPG